MFKFRLPWHKTAGLVDSGGGKTGTATWLSGHVAAHQRQNAQNIWQVDAQTENNADFLALTDKKKIFSNCCEIYNKKCSGTFENTPVVWRDLPHTFTHSQSYVRCSSKGPFTVRTLLRHPAYCEKCFDLFPSNLFSVQLHLTLNKVPQG